MSTFHLTDPLISIGGSDFKCFAEGIDFTSKDVMADDGTFCTPDLQTPTLSVWTVKVYFKQEFGAVGSDVFNTLMAIALTKQVWIVESVAGTVGLTSPAATFDATVPTPDFLKAKYGKSSPWDFEAMTIGPPVFATS